MAIDTSKSMLTTDIAPNRLERAKLAALELMQRSGEDGPSRPDRFRGRGLSRMSNDRG